MGEGVHIEGDVAIHAEAWAWVTSEWMNLNNFVNRRLTRMSGVEWRASKCHCAMVQYNLIPNGYHDPTRVSDVSK
jgi:hypothetical protein